VTTTLLTLEALANAFVTCKEIEGRCSKTVSWYRDILARFYRYVDETLSGATLANIGLAEASAFVHYLQSDTERGQHHPAVKTLGVSHPAPSGVTCGPTRCSSTGSPTRATSRRALCADCGSPAPRTSSPRRSAANGPRRRDETGWLVHVGICQQSIEPTRGIR
jgi:hypothetical protein